MRNQTTGDRREGNFITNLQSSNEANLLQTVPQREVLDNAEIIPADRSTSSTDGCLWLNFLIPIDLICFGFLYFLYIAQPELSSAEWVVTRFVLVAILFNACLLSSTLLKIKAQQMRRYYLIYHILRTAIGLISIVSGIKCLLIAKMLAITRYLPTDSGSADEGLTADDKKLIATMIFFAVSFLGVGAWLFFSIQVFGEARARYRQLDYSLLT